MFNRYFPKKVNNIVYYYYFQKCVCTTIKPSRLVYPDLNDLTSYSEFVCNHITYIKLEDPTIVVCIDKYNKL